MNKRGGGGKPLDQECFLVFNAQALDSNEALLLKQNPYERVQVHSFHSFNKYLLTLLGHMPCQGLESKQTQSCPNGINRLAEEKGR